MSKILITGSLGLVGSEAVDFFLEKGWEVVSLDNNQRSKMFGTPEKVITNPIDIRDEDKVEEGFKEFGPFDAIIHTAAQPSHDYSATHVIEDFEINVRGTLNLLEATRKYCPEAVFINLSTDKVYGTNMDAAENLTELVTRYHSDFPFDEDLSIDESMHSPFGVSKAAADLYVQEYGYYFGLKTTTFRPGCITGKRHEGAELHGFLAYLAKCIKEEKIYNIYGYKGKQVRDQIHAYDLVNAFWHVIQNPHVAQVYNIGGGEERSVSILEAIKLIEKKTGKTAYFRFDRERKGDRCWDVHDVSKFKKDYPEWEYTYSLQDIIDELAA